MKPQAKFCIVLWIAMIFVLIVSGSGFAADAAAKIGNTSYTTLESAVAAAANGDTIIVQKNIANKQLEIDRSGKSFTIDLNGFIISESSVNHAVIAIKAGDITIKNGSLRNSALLDVNGVGGIAVYSGGSAVLDDLDVLSSHDCAVYVWGADVEILSGTYTGFDDVIYVGLDGAQASDVTITSGTYSVAEGSDAGYDDGCFFAEPGCTISIKAGACVDPADWETVFPLQVTVIYFCDVSSTAWYRSYVYDLAFQGIIQGRSSAAYVPDGKVTRAEFAKILAAASGEDMEPYDERSSFSDVSPTAWYNKYVNWAAECGIVKGKGDGLFCPGDDITRQEMAVMLMRYLDEVAAEDQLVLPIVGDEILFNDCDAIASWAKEAVDTMVKASVIGGYGDQTFRPLNSASRAETAKMVSVFLASLIADPQG